MKKSIIAVALLSSFSASAVTVEELASHFYTVSTSAAKNATDIAALQVGKAPVGVVERVEKVEIGVVEAKGIAVKASESAANAIQGVADTNARVDEVKASVSAVEGKVDTAVTSAAAAQTTANRAEAKADMNTTSIGKVNERVDLVEQDMSATNHRIDSNEAAFNQWAAQSTARADKIASGVAHNSARLDKVEGDVAGLKSDVKSLGDKVGRVGAMAMAVGSLNYDGMASGGAVAVGTYNGKASIAAGAQFNVSDRSAANLQLAYDGKSVGAGAGYNFKW